MIYFLSINIITFLLCIIDKKNAIKKKYRIPEKELLSLSFVGGCFGMILGMKLFHHKTQKLKFKLVYLFCILWIIGYFYINKS